MELKGKVVVVTGASSGIGRETAVELAALGARLVVAARRRDVLDEVARACELRGAECLAVQCDVADAAQVDALAKAAVERFGRIDGWVNNAGVYSLGTVEKTPLETFRRVMDVNFFGTVHGCRAAARYLKAGGVIVNISSALGLVSGPYYGAYAASKHAVRAFTDALRTELRQSGVAVAAVFPPSIDTPLFDHSANYTGRALKPANPVYPVERVARTIIANLRRPARESRIGVAAAFRVMKGLVPALFDRLMASQTESGHFQDEPQEPHDGNLHRALPGGTSSDGGWLRGRLPSSHKVKDALQTASRLPGAIGAVLLQKPAQA